IAMSVKFIDILLNALNERIADDLVKRLVDSVEGEAGDKIADAYDKAVTTAAATAISEVIDQSVAERKQSAIEQMAGLKNTLGEATAQAAADVKNTARIRAGVLKSKQAPDADAAGELGAIAERAARTA